MAQRFRHTEMMELESPTESESRLTAEEAPPSSNSGGIKRLGSIPHLGIIMAIASSFFFSLSSLIVKLVPDVHPVALATYRFAGILLPSIPIVIRRSEDPFPKGKRWLLLLRAFLGTTSLMSQFYALRHMPLADASVIIFSVPVFVAIFARIFLKEECGLFHVANIFLTLCGCILIARPPFLFGRMDALPLPEDGSVYDNAFWGAVAALCGTLFAANVYVVIRSLKGLHFSVIMSSFGAFAILQTFMTTWAMNELCLPACGHDRWLMVLLAIFSFAGQILLTMALQHEQAGPVAIARSADVVFAFIWQVIFLNEIPGWISLIGALLVTTSVLLTGVRKWVEGLDNHDPLRQRLWFLQR
ncbi:solute carrier family 35 member G1-like [Daphnia pulex]|nr:solute carrier family 35 member G1-like [Daphnia pulex]